ncbi:hypothetical protein MHH28_06340 [Paenibacillus sp. FSL K6-1217]|uniref:hypothetical protein n=1 Tax=Paenibacillus sp. FSL K6-1217 TaxID=2921466 RepID=UPI00324511BD
MKQLLREMKHDHVLIFSTHILELAADLCDELALLHQGKLTRISAELYMRAILVNRYVTFLLYQWIAMRVSHKILDYQKNQPR